MSSTVDHNKIIRNAANAVLKPNGLFQKGTSRVWIEDNGWFLTQIEFQPSGWDRGAYLNVAISFLWRYDGYLGFDFSIGGWRVNDFVAFQGDEEKFAEDMRRLVNHALEKTMEYRKFRNLEYACTMRLASEYGVDEHNLYQKMMICGLCRDPRSVQYFEKLWGLVRNPRHTWIQLIKDELDEDVAPIIHDPQAFYVYILDKIRENRGMLRSKPSMKKMKQSFELNGEIL